MFEAEYVSETQLLYEVKWYKVLIELTLNCIYWTISLDSLFVF